MPAKQIGIHMFAKKHLEKSLDFFHVFTPLPPVSFAVAFTFIVPLEFVSGVPRVGLGAVASLVNDGFVVVSLLFPFVSSDHALIVYVPSAVIVKLPLVPVIVRSLPAPITFILATLVFVLFDVSLTVIVTVPM